MVTLHVIVCSTNGLSSAAGKLSSRTSSILYDRTLTNVDLDAFPYSSVIRSLNVLYSNVPHRILLEAIYNQK